jgi:hypothetical protein
MSAHQIESHEAGHAPDATRGDQPSSSRWQAVVTVVAMASWPFLSLVADNLDQPLDLAAVRTWWLVTLGVALALLAVVMVVGRRGGTRWVGWTGGVLGVALWLLFSLPLVVGLRGDGEGALSDLAWWGLVAGATMVVAMGLMWFRPVQRFAAIMAVVLAVTAGSQVVLGGIAAEAAPDEAGTPAIEGGGFAITPNVWFIALDGLASNDFMRARTDYDPTAFDQAMEADGFAIQDEATSNYPFTNLSIGSTLMMEYGFEGVDEPNAGPFFAQLQGANTTVELMRANGYAYAHTYPGLWSGSKCSGVEDLCIGDSGSLTDTETAMAAMTPLGELLTNRSRQADVAIANDPSHVVPQVIAADLPDPSFNFVHVLNPHAPLLRDADCGIREVELKFSAWGEGPEYAGAVACLHEQLETAVDQILAVDDDPVIVVQSDHGPRLGIDWSQPGGVFLDDDMYFSIFSAIRLPQACDDIAIPDDLTPVNTFRIVRGCLEQAPVDLLENRRFPIQAERG